MAVACDWPFAAGAVLKLRFSGAGSETAKLAVVRVANVRRLSGGAWRLGCEFTSALPEQEFDAIIKRTAPPG